MKIIVIFGLVWFYMLKYLCKVNTYSLAKFWSSSLKTEWIMAYIMLFALVWYGMVFFELTHTLWNKKMSFWNLANSANFLYFWLEGMTTTTTIYYPVSFDQSEGSILSLMELTKQPSYTKAILLEYNTLKGVKSYRAKEVSKWPRYTAWV